MALSEGRVRGIKRGLEALDRMLPMSPTMDGRLPLHQDCRELLAEVEAMRGFVRKMFDAAHHDDYGVLEDATTIEREAAAILGIAWPYDEDDG